MKKQDCSAYSAHATWFASISICKNPIGLLVLWCVFACPAIAQFDDDDAPAPDSPQLLKVFAVIELAKMAAEADQPEVSFEAIRRIATTGPVINKVDLGGLLSSPQQNSSSPFVGSSPMLTPQQQSASKVAAKMVQVNDLWIKKNFDAQKVFEVWFEQVFPKDTPNAINLHVQSNVNPNQQSFNGFSLSRNASSLPKTGAQCLIEWAIKADKMVAIEEEMAKRIVQPGNADLGWLFKIWIADAKKLDAAAYEAILEEIEPKMAAQIVGIHSDIKANAIREAMKKLPAKSELKDRLKKSFLKVLPTSTNWNSNTINNVLLSDLIMESIDQNDIESADSIAEAVISQWSAVRSGNEQWVRSMEAQAFQELATSAFEKKSFKLGSAWMQRCSLAGTNGNEGGIVFSLRNETTQQWLKCPPDIRYDVFSKSVWSTSMLGLSQMSSLMPEFLTPVQFRNSAQSPLSQTANINALSVSAIEWLMRDAIALGKRAEIEKKIQELADGKSDDLLLAKLVWQKANDRPIDLKALLETAAKDGDAKEAPRIRRLTSAEGPPLAIEVEIAELAMRDPNTKELGIELANRLLASCLKHNKTALMSQCRVLLHSATKESGKTPVTHERLKHFVEASDWDGGAVLDGIPSKAIWVSRNESHTSWGQETGLMQSYLFLKYPLTGDFEITFKARDGSYAEPGVAIGGIMTEFCPYNKTVALNSIGYRLMGSVNKKFDAYKQGEWNDYRIQRNAKEFRVSINSQLAVTIPSLETAPPFFALGAQSYRSSTLDELKINGKVTIPRQVELCTPRLAGWSSYYTNQWLEPIRLMENVSKEPSDDSLDGSESQEQAYDFENEESQKFPSWYGRENGDAEFAWSCKDGLLESVDQQLARAIRIEEYKKSGTNIPPEMQQILEQDPKKPRTISLIYYQRPLCDGETIELEFYQDSKPEPIKGNSRTLPWSISPVVGRTAMLLDQPDIALRWLAGQGESEWLGTDPDQRILDPNARQIAKPPIKERDWNTLTIGYNQNLVVLTINGQKCYERKWDTSVAPQFGLYHHPENWQVRVRNVRLTGRWPERLPENLFELTQ